MTDKTKEPSGIFADTGGKINAPGATSSDEMPEEELQKWIAEWEQRTRRPLSQP